MTEISVATGATSSTEVSEPLSRLVVETVAGAEGVDPLELGVPLYEAVDPDALDALFRSNDSVEGVIEFTYYGYEVRVSSSGHVSLDE
jgi:hypothetical protein